MYLKKYDLNKCDENTVKKMLETTFFHNDHTDIVVKLEKDTPKIRIFETNYFSTHVAIQENGIINIIRCHHTFSPYIAYDGSLQLGKYEIEFDITPEVQHLLLETQWIDPKDKMPGENMWCVVKIEDIDGDGTITITTAFYDAEDGYFYCDNSDYVYSWLPDDNVVM